MIFILFLIPVHAQDIASFSSLSPDEDPIIEELRSSPAISGARVVGIMRADTKVTDVGPDFLLRIPADWTHDVVCLRVVSVDALYEARASYQVPEHYAGQTVRLRFDSNKPHFWDALVHRSEEDAVTALVAKGSCDLPREQALAIPIEIGAPAEHSRVTVFLNTFRSEEAFVIWNGGEIECEPVNASIRTAFDMRCTVDLKAGGSSSASDLLIYPVRAGELGLPMTARLHP
ncbi:hypothetical protein [Roseinatronobacter bogoriensis]|uniref:Uncharacterized protein n=1 Tax=Roseinatronobacter bogoriensis subsp. barguzinensis TaxID=441209 RepID=A0A2K8K807_9RHOB|nr:hypothetical protein [Rhodobaca]ATX65581.1 hypothetical protein BG454_06870 [Rhodobaca barguzinensis]MBB4208497.1 hypothetical protein [Rhodobaca bogoriensis DSM 18756]